MSNQPRMRASVDEIIELPEDVDWVKAGFVEVLPDEPKPEIDLDELKVPGLKKKYQNSLKKLVEDATLAAPEKAVTREKGKLAHGSLPKGDDKLTADSKKQETKKPVTKSSQTKAGKK